MRGNRERSVVSALSHQPSAILSTGSPLSRRPLPMIWDLHNHLSGTRARSLKAVVFQHTWIKAGGNPPGESSPTDLAALAARHPDAALICGHTGGQWELGIRAVRASPNISIDLGGFDPTAGVVEAAV